MKPKEIKFLKKLFSTPTAPFREALVAQVIGEELKSSKIPYFVDQFGNLVVGVSDEDSFKKLLETKSQVPLCCFVAHMDHPGFHLTEFSRNGKGKFEWHGGGPTKELVGAAVWVSDKLGNIARGEITKVKLTPKKNYILSGALQLQKFENLEGKNQLFGGLDFGKFYWESGQRIYTKAADDLAGCFAIVSALQRFWKKANRAKNVQPLALLTIGEEVGWVGAIGHFQKNCWAGLKRPAYVVSVEASRAMPKAEIGKGAVVRLADKATAFDALLSDRLMRLSCKTLKSKFQFQIMNGGTCEGSVSTAWGVDTVALCVPLGNYHNQAINGGQRSSTNFHGPAPEFIDKRDLSGLVKICEKLCEQSLLENKGNDFSCKKKAFENVFREYKKFLP